MHMILCIDDDLDAISYLDLILPAGCKVCFVNKRPRNIEIVRKKFDVIFIDPQFASGFGRELLCSSTRIWPGRPIVAISDSFDAELIYECARNGIIDCVQKPIGRAHLFRIIERAKSILFHESQNSETAESAVTRQWIKLLELHDVEASHPGTRLRVASLLAASARVHFPILIVGERGVGKRDLALAIHRFLSKENYSQKGFLEISLPKENDGQNASHEMKELLLSVKACRLKRNNRRYTIYLKDIDRLGRTGLSQLEQLIIEERERNSNIRFICTVGADGKPFRGKTADYIAEIFKTVRLKLNPLRYKPQEIALLSRKILAKLVETYPFIEARDFTASALDRLISHSWQGNKRQLRRVISDSAFLTDGSQIDAHHLQLGGQESQGDDPIITEGDNGSVG